MNISFDKNWNKVIMPLKGKTIYTLDEQKANVIVDVNNDFLERSKTKPKRFSSILLSI